MSIFGRDFFPRRLISRRWPPWMSSLDGCWLPEGCPSQDGFRGKAVILRNEGLLPASLRACEREWEWARKWEKELGVVEKRVKEWGRGEKERVCNGEMGRGFREAIPVKQLRSRAWGSQPGVKALALSSDQSQTRCGLRSGRRSERGRFNRFPSILRH